MTSILLVLDTSDQQNWGCLATTSALHALLGSTFDNLELSTIQLGTIRKEFRTYNLPFLKGKIFEASSGNYHTPGTLSFFHRFISKYQVLAPKIEFFPQVSDEYDDKAQQWLRGDGGPVGDEFLAKARKSDIILINEEGCIVEQAKKGTRSLFLGYLAKKHLNKPVFIVNHTAHFKTSVPILLSMGKKTYPLMDGVVVREPYSKRNIEELGVLSQVDVVPDALFSLKFDEEVLHRCSIGEFEGLNNYACINGSSLTSAVAWKPVEGFTHIAAALRQKGFEVVITVKDQSDMFLKDVAKATESRFFGPEYSFLALYKLLSRSRLFISGRYHPIIISSMAGCPFVPLNANTHKIEGVCELLDYPIRHPFDMFDIQNEAEKILQASQELLDSYDTLSAHLKQKSAQLGLTARRNVTIVQEVLGQQAGIGTTSEK